MHSGVIQENVISTRSYWIALPQGKNRNEEQRFKAKEEVLGQGVESGGLGELLKFRNNIAIPPPPKKKPNVFCNQKRSKEL